MCAAQATRRQLVAKEGSMAQVRLPSGEVRYIDMNSLATIGQVSNAEHAPGDGGQGRPQSLEGQASDGAWRGHGPVVASAWRR